MQALVLELFHCHKHSWFHNSLQPRETCRRLIFHSRARQPEYSLDPSYSSIRAIASASELHYQQYGRSYHPSGDLFPVQHRTAPVSDSMSSGDRVLPLVPIRSAHIILLTRNSLHRSVVTNCIKGARKATWIPHQIPSNDPHH